MTRTVLLLAALALTACKSTETEPAPAASASVAAEPSASVSAATAAPPTSAAAAPGTLLAYVGTLELADSTGAKLHPSARKITTWAKREGKMTVAELDAFRAARRSTTIAIAMRDADLVRGHVVCVHGSILQIQGADVEGTRMYSIMMLDTASGLTVALGTAEDVGDTVEGSTRSFCGVFIGRYTFPTQSGGMSVVPSVVGLFTPPATARP